MTEENKKTFRKIHENYNYMNRMIVEELEIASQHSTLTGDYREQTWLELFRRIIPKKYSLAQGVMIIDSCGHISKEVDIVAYDEQYTPYIFQYNTSKFIPIEAVAIVVECKSTSWNNEKLKNWSDAIEKLKPKASGIARMANGYTCGITNETQKQTRPIKILATMKQVKEEETLENIKDTFAYYFDFIIAGKVDGDNENKKLEILIKNEEKSLGWWGRRLNEIEYQAFDKEVLKIQNMQKYKNKERNKDGCTELNFDENNCLKNTLKDLEVKNNPLLSLNLQLNQLLMLLNNPMLFPHFAYAETFKKIISDSEEEQGRK
ncbi:hypothetical protein GOQ29_01840 [Clostridium sp. D2Q-14]|uniref:DUF6602 domain-containing protein n=1 Tax=Anaeromonas gelatinilytica TaxID=2683194 RepID=UPI00193C5D9C|nr:DUF6602 domain-containing protein [Anaeromonas gelatinilytica]MBS4534355.1 hypothetical protein [Anaeromonas gelatinilytica]